MRTNRELLTYPVSGGSNMPHDPSQVLKGFTLPPPDRIGLIDTDQHQERLQMRKRGSELREMSLRLDLNSNFFQPTALRKGWGHGLSAWPAFFSCPQVGSKSIASECLVL